MTTPNPADKITVNYVLGCDPQINVEVTQTPQGSLFFKLSPVTFDGTEPDLDGLFLNLSDDSTLSALNFYPEANTLPVTGQQAEVNMVDTLANGAMTADKFDVAIQFGTVEDSTEGTVNGLNFTLWSDDGPLTLDDIDLDSMSVIINSDGDNGMVLTVADAADADDTPVEVVALSENFDDIDRPDESDAIVSDDRWATYNDKLATNGYHDGAVTFAPVESDGPVSISLDINALDTTQFEAGGRYGDSLNLEVQIDGKWITLDTFEVNGDGTALVGSETGQSFGDDVTTLSYSGGALDDVDGSLQFRMTSDISACNEQIFIDNVEITVTESGAAPTHEETVTLTEDFDDLAKPEDSDNIVSDDRWAAYNDTLATNGYHDGTVTFAPVESDGPASISLDINAWDTSQFEAGGRYGDSLKLEAQIDGEWITLDTFEVNSDGTAFVGSETGQTFGDDVSTLTYSGGALDDVDGTLQFRMTSDISACNEKIFIDNVEITTTTEVDPADDCIVTEDFEGLNSGDTVSDQFDGFTVSAQRAGDSDDSQNDAMIFDTDNPTGRDWDLGYADQGNAIIISEDNDASDADDNYGGGTISFNFDTPSQVVSLNVLDIEEKGGTVDLFDADGELIRTLDIPLTGNNGQGTLDIDVEGVSVMDVNLTGSGAVDDLKYISPACDDCTAQYEVGYLDLPMIDIPEDAPVADDEAEDLIPA